MFRRFPLSAILSTLLILATALLLSLPVLHDGLFHVFDNVQVTRVIAMYQELASGQFPVRYVNSFGHGAGSLIFRFYSPLIYYLGAGIYALGFSSIQSVKLVYLVAIVIGCTGIYTLLRSSFARLPSTLGTIAFLSAPYLYHDLYHRGSLTESFAFMLIPWVLWSFFMLRTKRSSKYLAFSAFSLGITILAHSITAATVIVALIVFSIITKIHATVLKNYLLALALALALASFYLLPAITSINLISYENNNLFQQGYIDHPIPFTHQLLAIGQGIEKSSFLGIPLFLSYFALLWIRIRPNKLSKNYLSLANFLLITLTGLFFFMSPASQTLWEQVKYIRYIQFPFRLLTITTVLATIAYTLVLNHLRHRKILFSLLTGLLILPFFIYPRFYQTLGYQYTTNYTVDDPCMTNTWANEYLTKWTTKCLLQPQEPLAISLNKGVQITNVIETNNGRKITLTTEGEGEILISKYYFPNWTAEDGDGNILKLEPYGDSGLIKLSTLHESTKATLSLTPSNADKVSNLISIMSLVYLVIMLKHKKNESN